MLVLPRSEHSDHDLRQALRELQDVVPHKLCRDLIETRHAIREEVSLQSGTGMTGWPTLCRLRRQAIRRACRSEVHDVF
jgi:hypothetical protein